MFMKIEGGSYKVNNHLAKISEDLFIDLIIKSAIQDNNAFHLKKNQTNLHSFCNNFCSFL